jgi:single-stranded DNA-binding protein
VSLPLITGTARIVADPKRGVTKTNEPWASAIVRFTGYRKVDGKWEEDTSFGASVVAFGDTARALFAFAKGDEVEIHGKVKNVTVWQPATGEPRPQLQLVAEIVEAGKARAPRQPAGAAA